MRSAETTWKNLLYAESCLGEVLCFMKEEPGLTSYGEDFMIRVRAIQNKANRIKKYLKKKEALRSNR